MALVSIAKNFGLGFVLDRGFALVAKSWFRYQDF